MASLPRILVTGAGGFIGGRVVEILHLSQRATVIAGVRRWGSAVRIARHPVEIRMCDVTDPQQVDDCVREATHVVHCATGGADVDVEGTRQILEAAERHGIQRTVYLSTVAVFGDAEGTVTEERPDQPGASAYGDGKIEAERVCRSFSERGVPLTILRPTMVYGPFSEAWVVEFVGRMRQGPWMLPPRDCQGPCNLLYVDDLVAAIELALHNPSAIGETFIISGADRATWHDYFVALHRVTGLPPLRVKSRMTSRISAAAMMPVRKVAKGLMNQFGDAILALYKKNALARRLMRRTEATIRQTPTMSEFRLYSRRVQYSTAKAERTLGYRPTFPMERALELIGGWLKHHRYC